LMTECPFGWQRCIYQDLLRYLALLGKNLKNYTFTPNVHFFGLSLMLYCHTFLKTTLRCVSCSVSVVNLMIMSSLYTSNISHVSSLNTLFIIPHILMTLSRLASNYTVMNLPSGFDLSNLILVSSESGISDLFSLAKMYSSILDL
jgi:hypothetical protein